VVTTDDLDHPRVLLLDQVRTNGERQTVSPKGRLEPGEAPLAAAIREVTEEAGVTNLRYAAYLGQQSYTFIDNDSTPAEKSVDWFLFTTSDTTTAPAAEEGFVAARWVGAREARTAASHAKFGDILDRALTVLEWRATGPLPISPTVDTVVRDVAAAASRIVAAYPTAGVGLCGSAARGDFVDGWSDFDFIGWGMPADAPAAEQLADLIAKVSNDHGVRASLHLADHEGRDARDGSPLHDMKMRAVLARVGIDVPVIAGVNPQARWTIPAPTIADIQLLTEFAVEQLRRPVTTEGDRRDVVRRTLSVLCSAARIAVTTLDTATGLGPPQVATALAKQRPSTEAERLLHDYDRFRRAGAHNLNTAERLAKRVPDALTSLRRVVQEDERP
jgi:8-oxo-dGTP pyrophosphatase MutT (NUDIX family)